MKRKLVPLPDGIEVGKVVSYYLNGWRLGTLQEVKGNLVGIKPVGTYLHDNKNMKWVNITDLKRADESH